MTSKPNTKPKAGGASCILKTSSCGWSTMEVLDLHSFFNGFRQERAVQESATIRRLPLRWPECSSCSQANSWIRRRFCRDSEKTLVLNSRLLDSLRYLGTKTQKQRGNSAECSLATSSRRRCMRDFQALQHLKCSTYLVVPEYDELSGLKSVENHITPSFLGSVVSISPC